MIDASIYPESSRQAICVVAAPGLQTGLVGSSTSGGGTILTLHPFGVSLKTYKLNVYSDQNPFIRSLGDTETELRVFGVSGCTNIPLLD